MRIGWDLSIAAMSNKRLADRLRAHGAPGSLEALSKRISVLRSAARQLAPNASTHAVRAWVSCFLSIRAEQIQELRQSPIPPLLKALDTVIRMIQETAI